MTYIANNRLVNYIVLHAKLKCCVVHVSLPRKH